MRCALLWRPRRDGGHGFTLIELVVVVCLVAIFFKVALDRLLIYQEAAEKAAMEQTVAVIKSALQLRAADMLIRGDERNIGSLARVNPVDLLVEPPGGYRGEFFAPNVDVPRGSWYFDAVKKELVYVPSLDAHLKFPSGSLKRIRFRVELDYASSRGRGETTGDGNVFEGTRFTVVTPYAWF